MPSFFKVPDPKNNIRNSHGNAYIGDTHGNVEPATPHVLSAEKTTWPNVTVTRFRHSYTFQINWNMRTLNIAT
jgi:hypothetical protein